MPGTNTILIDRIKAIQRALKVKDDGIIGPDTLSRIEDLIRKEVEANYSLTVSRKSVEAIIQYEISSDTYYDRYLKSPIWPGVESGITIGIGYDLGYNTAAEIQKAWKGLDASDLAKLVAVAGLKGTEAKKALSKVKSVKVPLAEAKKVFYEVTLPAFARLTLTTYPGTDELFHDAQGALLSLIYNRGASLANTDRRKEMRVIKALVVRQDYAAIAAQIRSMKRLWDVSSGLIVRREKEAAMVEKSDRSYSTGELIRV